MVARNSKASMPPVESRSKIWKTFAKSSLLCVTKSARAITRTSSSRKPSRRSPCTTDSALGRSVLARTIEAE